MSRASVLSRFSLTAGAVLALTGCLDHPIKKVAYDKSAEAQKNVAIAINKDVDVLFIIDNSGSMAEEQRTLSANFAAFIEVLEQPDVNANYRIGITTTDSGNPRCGKADTTPEAGRLVLSSCVDRVGLGEFVFGVDEEDFSFACTEFCELDDAALAIKPTETQVSGGKKEPRKWIERIEGTTNLPDGVSAVQAFQCFGPQGVAGCGFESHLESMYLALAKATRENEPTNYGFMRDSAILSIVMVTDEADCSYTAAGANIFTTNKVFWNDPTDVAPTSAVCWRAGVKCEGDTCRSMNYDAEGTEDVADEAAVLQPLKKYKDFVQKIEDDKRKFDAGQEVLVALIAGVPVGYETNAAEIAYEQIADPADPNFDFQTDFGVAPGCILETPDASGRAVPPVREREFAEAFEVGDQRNLFSICQNDYSKALEAIATKIRDQIQPACMPNCVRDADPATPVLDPNCQLFEENLALGTREEIVACEEVAGEWVAPAGETACFAQLVDKGGQTPSAIDDLSQECKDKGWNLEFELIRSSAAPAGTTISAACELSINRKKDCPNL